VGISTNFFIATAADVRAMAYEAEKPPPHKAHPTVESKGLYPELLEHLAELLDADGDMGEPERDWGKDGPWVFELPDELVSALSRLQGKALDEIARRWADTACVWVTVLGPLLSRLATLAARARSEKKGVYLWVCM